MHSVETTGGTPRLEAVFERNFRVAVVSDLFTRQPASEALLGFRRALLVTTPTVDKFYGERARAWIGAADIDCDHAVVPLSEDRKNMQAVEDVCALAVRHDLGRRDAIIAFGGGVCSDVVGFAASMIRRGIQHVRIPTTLVGQIDAAIGIKGGVNFRNRKNYLGCFYPPSAVFVDPTFLRTLERKHILQGVAEILKIALVVDGELFEGINQHGRTLVATNFQTPPMIANAIIRRAIELMLAQLQSNPFENRSLRRLVDMGHTFSQTLEEESGFTIAHGEAVAIDMALTSMLAVELGIMPSLDAERVVYLLKELGLPIWSPLLSARMCETALDHAKAHRGGELNLVVAPRIGSGDFVPTAERLDGNLLAHCIRRLHECSTDKAFQRAHYSFAG